MPALRLRCALALACVVLGTACDATPRSTDLDAAVVAHDAALVRDGGGELDDAANDPRDAATGADGASSADDAAGVDASAPPDVDGGAPSARPLTIVVLGSSTAAGKNLDQPMYGGRVGGLEDRWASRYERYLQALRPGSVVMNLGVSSYQTFTVLPTDTTTPIPSDIVTSPLGSGRPDPMRNITYAIGVHADAIIVSFSAGSSGTGLRGDAPVSQILANMHEIVDAADAAGIPIWVTLPNPAVDAARIAQQRDLRDGLLAELGERALDFYTPRLDADGTAIDALTLLMGDTHPNAEGHRVLFDVVVAADIPAAVAP